MTGDRAASDSALLLEQAFDSDSMYQLRSSVAAHGEQAGLSTARAQDLVVAVHELAANVVRHGSGRGRLIAWQHDSELHCQVIEDGADGATEPDRAPAPGSGEPDSGEPGNGPPWRIEPGHGLWLVRQLADRVSDQAAPGRTAAQPGPAGTATTITFALPS